MSSEFNETELPETISYSYVLDIAGNNFCKIRNINMVLVEKVQRKI